jgi:GT2 family glycosyltransferase
VNRPRVTAVVLTYNRRDLLDVILPTLERQTIEDLRVIVVDDGSHDGSAEYVRERWPAMEVLALEQNVGVTAAMNRGLEAAVSCEYVALLNNDLELSPDFLALLVNTLDGHPEAASATGKLLSFHDRGRLDGAGDKFMWSVAATRRGYGERDVGQYDRPEAVFSPCAGAALYRRAAFDVVGTFDEDFFAYLEDVDWGLRAQLTGFSARYEPRAVAFHMGGATTQAQSRRFFRLQRRNQIWLVAKNYPAPALVRHAGKLVLHQGSWIVSAAREGALREQLAALAAALRGLPGVMRKRRAVQATRRVSFAQLDAVVSPEPYAGDSLARRLRSIGGELATLWRR